MFDLCICILNSAEVSYFLRVYNPKIMIAFLGSYISSLKAVFADFGTVELKYYDYMKCILVFDVRK